MLSAKVKNALETKLQTSITSSTTLSGGDINTVYLLSTSKKKYVIKLNSANKFPGMFEAEKEGLALLENTHTLRIPTVYFTEHTHDVSFILMEHITHGNKNKTFWEDFGTQLAKLHQTTSNTFGLNHNNYIGSLVQYNKKHVSIHEFYITQRLEPQLSLAKNNGFDFGNLSNFFKNLEGIIPVEKPALVHGDLWSGNYLVNENGSVCLIDPAVSFMHRETDIAMMHLFGGFSSILFESYNEFHPLQSNWNKRLDIWQLYYLLVHVNLFGMSYYHSAKAVIKKYN
jgi:hypothetical protein